MSESADPSSILAGEMEHLHRVLMPLRSLHNAHYIAPLWPIWFRTERGAFYKPRPVSQGRVDRLSG